MWQAFILEGVVMFTFGADIDEILKAEAKQKKYQTEQMKQALREERVIQELKKAKNDVQYVVTPPVSTVVSAALTVNSGVKPADVIVQSVPKKSDSPFGKSCG